ncbi:MAG: hypothetical protein MI919_26850, partial [Holophagales bacterium]|nr:hypothetical protein [Holophagales bacterium]
MIPARFRSLERSDFGLLTGSFLILFYCVYCAYLSVVEVNLRFILDPPNWTVLSRDRSCDQAGEACLQKGDRVLRMGTLDLETFRSNPLVSLYRDWENEPDIAHPVVYERDGEIRAIWLKPYPKIRWGSRKYAVWFFPLMFWVAGTIAVLFLRPRDGRWLVLVLLCYNTALWGASGFVSGAHAGISAVVFFVAIWFFVPLLLHLHLILPSRRFLWAERYLLIPTYALALVVSTVGLFRPVGRD